MDVGRCAAGVLCRDPSDAPRPPTSARLTTWCVYRSPIVSPVHRRAQPSTHPRTASQL